MLYCCVCVVFPYVFFIASFTLYFFNQNNSMNKSMRYLYGHLIPNYETCVNCLQERNLLTELGSCSKLIDDVICGGTLKLESIW